MKKDAVYWIRCLGLQPHPEGGYFKETYRSMEMIKQECLPKRFTTAHCLSTAIFYLLESPGFSAFHRIKSDEVWHFYDGSPVRIYCINPDGMLFEVFLGNDPENGQLLQAHIRAGHWFAAAVEEEYSYALVGCTVAPGFEFNDFELGSRSKMLAQFPRHKDLILRLTRG
jgi:predicted cupin superfamily sugar epimerase